MQQGVQTDETCNIQHCFMAENFFPTARALIGYFEVTWHLTMKMFPAKISERANLVPWVPSLSSRKNGWLRSS